MNLVCYPLRASNLITYPHRVPILVNLLVESLFLHFLSTSVDAVAAAIGGAGEASKQANSEHKKEHSFVSNASFVAANACSGPKLFG
mgnify:CR=1 FL=1